MNSLFVLHQDILVPDTVVFESNFVCHGDQFLPLMSLCTVSFTSTLAALYLSCQTFFAVDQYGSFSVAAARLRYKTLARARAILTVFPDSDTSSYV
jgi:hypothetical protein